MTTKPEKKAGKNGRPKKPVNPERTKRFNIFLDDQKEKGLTQEKLAKMIYVSQQIISRIKKGQADLTEPMAIKIHEVFPEYRLQWLLGIDNYKTDKERLSATFTRENESLSIVEELIHVHGYSVSETLSPTIKTEEKTGRDYQDLLIKITSPSGRETYMPPKHYMELLRNVNDILEGLLLLEFKQNTDGSKEYWRR